MPPRGHADGGGGDEALEVGRRRGRGLVSPELRRRLCRFLNCRGCRSQRLVLLVEEVAAWRGAVEAVGGAGGNAGDGHGDGTVKLPRANRRRGGLGSRVFPVLERWMRDCERGEQSWVAAWWGAGED